MGIVGAGPAGLTLGHLLDKAGIDTVILEDRSREYVEARIRAGVIEQGVVDMLVEAGAGERLRREGLVHHGIELQFAGERHRIPLSDLAGGKAIVIYGQTELVKDLIRLRLETGRPLHFEVTDVSVHDLDTERPLIRYLHEGGDEELECDVIAGCDGFHGICRPSIPTGVLSEFSRDYPFGWLGILAAVAPSNDELVDDIANWSDDRIWHELQTRLGLEGWTLAEGPILERGVTGMRSYVCEPMRYGRLFIAGDAAHIVPPTGAKGLNLAIHDVRVLAEALSDWYGSGSATGLNAYSDMALRRVWRAEHFSWWMTQMLHRPEDGDAFDLKLQLSQLRYIASSRAAATSLAENYVGLDTI